MRIRRALALACFAASVLAADPARAVLANYEDWWWNPDQSGHGVNVGQQDGVLFVSWFTYDEAGAGMWLTLAGTLDGASVTGDWIRTTGPALGTAFDPAQVRRTVVGTGTITFESLHQATLAWTVNGKSGTVPLIRQSWAVTQPLAGQHLGRMRLEVRVCPGGVTYNLPITSTYFVNGTAITIIDDFRASGTKVCTMDGTLTPSGSYWRVEGRYTCVNNAQSGTWTGTLRVQPPFMLRDEVLLLDGNACVYNQSTVTSPAALE